MTPETPKPPKLEVTSPEEGEVIGDEVSIEFAVDDGSNGSGIDIVYIFIDNRLVHKDDEDADESKDFNYIWDCSDAEEGNHYIKIDAYDRAGNLTEKEITVYKGEAPIVTSTDPQDAAREVPIDLSPITIRFSKPMDETTTTPAVQTPFDCSKNWSSDKVIEIIPDGIFDYCSEYTITVTDDATDTSGVHLDGNKDGRAGGDYPFIFTIEQPPIDLTINPECANVEEGRSLTPKVTADGKELKKDVDCKLDYDVGNPGGWAVYGAEDEDFTLFPKEKHQDAFTLTNGGATAPLRITCRIPIKCGIIHREGYYWTSFTHLHDHPDENQSPGIAQYPTPWITRTQSIPSISSQLRADSILPVGLPDIGILLSGWADGYGHILGKYKMATLPVKPNLEIINNPEINKTFTTENTEKKTHREHRDFIFLFFNTKHKTRNLNSHVDPVDTVAFFKFTN